MAEFALKFKLTPTLDVPALTGKLDSIKKLVSSGLGNESFKPFQSAIQGLGGTFSQLQTTANSSVNNIRSSLAMLTVVGEKGSEEFKQLTQQLKIAETEAKKFDKALGSVTGGADSGAAQRLATFGLAAQGIQTVSDQVSQLTAVGIEYEGSLAAVSAITGFTGTELDKLGESSRKLAVTFGGSANDQLKSFQGILSKLGPEMAQDSKALELLATNVNTLSKASGDDAAQSMGAIVDAMLQMGLASGTPAEIAKNSTDVMNALAASAQVGAAEIPQVAQALLQAGVAAKGAGLDIVDANAALQVLAVGGKTGSEAGIALRNVLGLMQKNSKEANDAMMKMGFSLKDLGSTLNEKGLPAALELIKGGLSKLGSQAERNATLMQIFGSENSAAAGIMMENLPLFDKFSAGIKDGMEGVGSAVSQANTRMDTSGEAMSRMKAAFDDTLISLQQNIGPAFSAFAGFGSQIAPMVMSLGMMPSAFGAIKDSVLGAGKGIVSMATSTGSFIKDGVSGFGKYVSAAGGIGPAFSMITGSIWGAVKASIAFIATPMGATLLAITAVGAGVAYLAGAFDESAASRLKDSDAMIEHTNKMIETNKTQQAEELKKMDLVSRYETLIKKQVNSQDEQIKKDRELDELRNQLNKKYPQTIDLTASHAANLDKLKEATHLVGIDTAKFTDENKNLVKEFESLNSKTARTSQENARLSVVTKDLNTIFPEAKIGTLSFSDSLKTLKEQAGLSSAEISRLQGDLSKMSANMVKLNQQNANLKFWDAKEALQGSFDFLTGNKVTFSKFAERMAQDISKAKNDIELNSLYNVWTEEIDKLAPKLGKEEVKMRQGLETLKSLWSSYNHIFDKPVDAKVDIQPKIDTEAADKAAATAKEKAKKEAKEEKDYTDEINKAKLDNQKLQSLLSSKINSDKYKDDLEQLKLKHQGENNEIDKDIREKEKTLEKSRKDGHSKEVKQLNELLDILKEKSTVTLERQTIDIQEFNQKFIKEQQKIYESSEKDVSDNLKKQLELNRAVQNPTLQLLKDRLALEKTLIHKGFDEEIQGYLEQNSKYTSAYDDLYVELSKYEDKYKDVNIAELLSSKDFTAIDDEPVRLAFENILTTIDKIIAADDFLYQKRTESNNQLNEAIRSNSFLRREIELKNITDTNQYEYESKKLSLDKTLSLELSSVGKNYVLRKQAFQKYAFELKKAEMDLQLAQSSIWLKTGKDIANALTSAFGDIQIVDNSSAISEQKKVLAQYDEEEKKLKEQMQNREISDEQFKSSMDALVEKKKETNDRLNELDQAYWITFKSGLASAMSTFVKTQQVALNKSTEDWKTALNDKSYAENEFTNAVLQMSLNVAQGKAEAYASDLKAIQTAQEEKTLAEQKANESLQATFIQTGAIVGGTFMQLIAEEKGFVKASIMAILAGTKAMIPLLAVQILGKEFVEKSLAGAVTAGIMSGVLFAAVSAAESAVMSMQFRQGGYTGNAHVDQVVGVVHGQEEVMTAEATRISGNREAVEWANKNRKPMKEYFFSDPAIIEDFKIRIIKDMTVGEFNKLNNKSSIRALGYDTINDNKTLEEHVKLYTERTTKFIKKEELNLVLNQKTFGKYIELEKANQESVKQLSVQNDKLDKLIKLTEEGNYKRQTTNKINLTAEFDTNRLVKLQQIYRTNRLVRL